MNLDTFLSERQAVWEELERALKRSRGRPERLGPSQALELGRSYRAVAADLAMARRRFPGDPVVDRLERLTLAGRQAIYSERTHRLGSLGRFLARDYWRLIVERPGLLAVSWLAMLGPTVLCAIWAIHSPTAALGLVPGRFKPAAGAGGHHITHIPLGAATQAVLASSIFTNNIGVTFLAFAGGLALGLGTIAILAFNGVLLGTLAGLTIQAGNFSVFLRYVVPHGLLELSCIAVSGAAGLRIGWAFIDPGVLPRGISVRDAARPAVAMVLGTAPWLIVAGLTEGFLTPRGIPLGPALAVGGSLAGVFWLLALTRGRRQSRARDLAST
jgi:uncharacterized membrane protein SpoIIM required for sporulation